MDKDQLQKKSSDQVKKSENAQESGQALSPPTFQLKADPIQKQDGDQGGDGKTSKPEDKALGDKAEKQGLDPGVLTMEEVRQLFSDMSSLTFEGSDGVERNVPFHYPPDGCYARAHLMARAMEARGIESEKVFAMSRRADGSAGLEVQSDYAPYAGSTSIQWRYHVAPVVRVQNDEGAIVQMVIDPSIASGPITLEQWLSTMNPDEFEHLTEQEVAELRDQEGTVFVPGRSYYYTASDNTMFPDGAGTNPTAQDADTMMESLRPRMTQYADQTVVTEAVASVRQQTRATNPSADAIIAAFNRLPEADRRNIWQAIEPERNALQAVMSAEEFARIEASINGS